MRNLSRIAPTPPAPEDTPKVILAQSHEVSAVEISDISDIDALAFQVQRRLTAIAMACATLKAPELQGPPRKNRNRGEANAHRISRKKYNRKASLEDKGHTLERIGKTRWRCVLCRQSYPERETAKWLALGNCPGIPLGVASASSAPRSLTPVCGALQGPASGEGGGGG